MDPSTTETLQDGDDIAIDSALSIAVGVIYFIVSSICLSLYLLVLMIFYHDDELNMLSTYRIMFQMGIFDCIHLAVHAASGISTIISAFGIQIGNLFAINKIFGAILNSAWYPLNVASFCLAVDRFLRLVIDRYYDQIFSNRTMKMFIASYWFIYASMFLLCVSPWCSFLYDTVTFNWSYNENGSADLNDRMEWLDHMLVLVLIIFEAVLYGAMVREMFKKFGMYAKFASERNLTIQLVCVYSFEVLTIIQWQVIEPRFTVFESNAYLAFSNFLWIVWNGLRPFLYVSFNRKLRRKLLLMLLRFALKHHISTVSATGLHHRTLKKLPPHVAHCRTPIVPVG